MIVLRDAQVLRRGPDTLSTVSELLQRLARLAGSAASVHFPLRHLHLTERHSALHGLVSVFRTGLDSTDFGGIRPNATSAKFSHRATAFRSWCQRRSKSLVRAGGFRNPVETLPAGEGLLFFRRAKFLAALLETNSSEHGFQYCGNCIDPRRHSMTRRRNASRTTSCVKSLKMPSKRLNLPLHSGDHDCVGGCRPGLPDVSVGSV